jgi:pimeloyl-ACP methyl ester carboxylesterase
VHEGYADLSGRRLWYRDSGGSGATLVLLHARSGSSLFWEKQFPAFTAAGLRVVAYDRVGHGRSTLQGGEAGTAAGDLAALADHLRLERFHLLGSAAGGIVATDFALSFPQRLRSLVVANSIVGVQDEAYVALGKRLRPAPQFDALPEHFRELGPQYRAADAAGEARWIELEHASTPQTPLTVKQGLRNRITFALLETIRTPTLLLTGDADLYTPPAVLQLFAARIRHAEIVLVENCGHSAYWEQPEIFNRAVLKFLGTDPIFLQ